MVFFNFAYVNKATAYIEGSRLTKMNTMYSELLADLYSRSSKSINDFKAWTCSLKRRVRELKNSMARLFADHCECGLFKMKLHLLDHSFDDLEKIL